MVQSHGKTTAAQRTAVLLGFAMALLSKVKIGRPPSIYFKNQMLCNAEKFL